MKMLKIRNWGKWQTYRSDREQPPWIKVHRRILRDPEWVSLTDFQRGQIVAIWLLAADRDGQIPSCPKLIKKLCFMDKEPDLKTFIDKGFIDDDANVTSTWRQGDALEETRLDKTRLEKSISQPGVGLTPDDILKLWNKTVDSNLPRVNYLTPKRETALKTLIRIFPELEWWNRYFLKINNSAFLTGRNGKGWKCNFDWALNKTNLAKIEEGNYENKSPARNG